MHLLHVGRCTKWESERSQLSPGSVSTSPSVTLGSSKAQKQSRERTSHDLESPQSSGELLQQTTDHQLLVHISNSIPTLAVTGLVKIQNPPSRALHSALGMNA